ncbi:hypothetical protein [Halobacterium salinarum]|uniref:hypothetical protein n=1 Tax=Halobacterium salinarum TaxID=2242 RepID=UPI00255330F7|nr:hypothetical protein [Halobacterium salinarum]MDL0144537.1 hypothetical protein [Halobacterium salinarum]
MTETTTVSMPSELKQFADEQGISLSKLVQDQLKEERKKRGGREEELRNRKAKIEREIEILEDDLAHKQEQLEEIEQELTEIEEQKSNLASEMVEVVEALHSEDITAEQASKRTDNLQPNEIEACYEECVADRRFEDSVPTHIRKLVESSGADPNQLVLSYSERDTTEYADAKEVIQDNITGLERERIEEWVQSNLEN